MARATLAGRPGSPGVGSGRLLWIPAEPGPASSTHAGARPPGGLSASGGPDAATETHRLKAALATAEAELLTLAREAAEAAGPEIGAIFEAQALFATDPGIVDPAIAAIDGGATAEDAIDRAAAAQADALASVDDEYFRERAADVRDVSRRVVDILTGRPRPTLHRPDGAPAVVASADLEPSLVVALRRELVAGIALAGGAPTGHAAIVARALGIPLALGLGPGLDERLDGSAVAVDGSAGRLLVEPDAADLENLAAAADLEVVPPSSTADIPVNVAANVGSVHEAEAAAASGADAIGLVRTELLFLGRSTPPGLDEQRAIYRAIAGAMPDRRVVFRTLDIGGDKPAPYLAAEPEMNPALGVRGIRLSLARPDLFETQLRALLEAVPGATLSVMLPMVAALEEVTRAREALDQARAASIATGSVVAADVRLGIMVEVPSAALQADAFAPVVDFFSIGTNDLIQYALAADRTNAGLAELASPLQPAVLRLVRAVTDAARIHGRPVSVCGEAAGDPLAGPLFVGLGVDQLSVAPGAIAGVRARLAGIDVEACRAAAARACAAGTVAEVRSIADELLARGASAAPPGAREPG